VLKNGRNGAKNKVGVRVTEVLVEGRNGARIELKASVSALMIHYPDCVYFTADEREAAIT
jgi:hypothetical protein